MSKNYFDKFIDDQLKRAERIRQTRNERQVLPENDKKRNMVNHYRERVKNLVKINRKKNG